MMAPLRSRIGAAESRTANCSPSLRSSRLWPVNAHDHLPSARQRSTGFGARLAGRRVDELEDLADGRPSASASVQPVSCSATGLR